MTVRLDGDLHAKLTKIAEVNGIQPVDVLRLCLARGLPMVEAGKLVKPGEVQKLEESREPVAA